MGCASSSPLVNGGPGGFVENAKTAATDIMSTGEKAINEMGENLAEQVTHAKDTIVESINGVTNSISKVKDDAMTEIPLKDPNDVDADENHLIEENFENLKNEMLTKAQNAVDDSDKITDDLIKDTEDVIRDAETDIVELKNDAVEKMDAMKDEIMDVIKSKSPTHSLDSLKTSVAEPEIENILNRDEENHFSPEATMNELEELTTKEEEVESKMLEEDMEKTVETASAEQPQIEDSKEEPVMMKTEDDLVVEDVKSTDENESSEAQIGKKLEKSYAIDEEDNSSHDDDSYSKYQNEGPSSTHWEELHDIYFQKRFSRPLNASMESVLLEDEEKCTINLTNLYDEDDSNLPINEIVSSVQSRKAFVEKQKISDDTLDVIDELLKNIEKEVENEGMNDDIPIVNIVENE